MARNSDLPLDVDFKTLSTLSPEQRVGVESAYNTLVARLDELARAVVYTDRALPAYVEDLPMACDPGAPLALREASQRDGRSLGGPEAREHIARLMTQLRYLDYQAPRSTLRGPGLLAGSAPTMALVEQVRVDKAVFKQRASVLNAQQWTAFRASSQQGRINLLQAYRPLYALPDLPEKIRFVWQTRACAIAKLRVSDAYALIEKSLRRASHLSAAEIQQISHSERAILNRLPPVEVVCVRRPLQPHIELLAWIDQTPQNCLPASLPVFYPASRGRASLPDDLQPVPPIPSAPSRSPRSDVRIESTPILPRLNLYRYNALWRARQTELDSAKPSSGSIQAAV